MFDKFPSSVGREPVNDPCDIERDFSVVIFPIKVGIVPFKPGLTSTQCSIIFGIPCMYDKSPEMKASEMYRYSRLGNDPKTAGTLALNAFPSSRTKFKLLRPLKTSFVRPPSIMV